LAIASDSILRVSGINKIQFDTWNRPRSFRVLMRSAADVAVLKPPPFWTLHNAVRLGAVATGVTVVAIAWIGVLRRRVAQRTAELAESNQRLYGEIEERKRAQHELARALETEKDLGQLKSRFVSLVSHEFRTPLGNIQSSAGLLLKYFDRLALERRNQLLGNIADGTQRMAAMMEDVLLLSRVESATYECEPEPVSLADFCHRVVDEVQSATSQRCHLETRLGSLPVARADTNLLRHLLTNLLTNAVKYSAAGGTVELEAICANSHAEFIVRDHGIGIPSEDQARVFEAFHRGSNVGEIPGTGLGLVIVKRCVDLLCGDISVESQTGVGTTVRVRLPVKGDGHETSFVTRESAPAEDAENSTKTNL
jgi:signal transduction histidine kinase